MNSTVALHALLAVAIIALVAWAAGAGQRTAPTAAELPALPKCELPATSAPQWHALPGLRLELGATGYFILLGTQPMVPLYRLIAPEGYVAAFGVDLPALKNLAERLARERAEFEQFGPEAMPVVAALQQLQRTAR